jgi:hypothetical protein
MPGESCEELGAAGQRPWQRLARGSKDRRHGFHLVQLATVDGQGAPICAR